MKQLIANPAAAVVLMLSLAAGCKNCCPRPQPPCPPVPVVPPPGAVVTPILQGPPRFVPNLPPPLPPSGPVVTPLPQGPAQFVPELPPPLPPPSESKSAPADMTWKPGNCPSVRLAPPEVSEEGSGKNGALLYPPIVADDNKPPPPKVEAAIQPNTPAAFPTGIPQFAMARDKVANGLRPSLDDGLDWLQANGYKTVVCVDEPGEQIAPDRKQVEKRGLKFIALEVSPLTLNQKVIDEFNRLVDEAGNQPLFVYDRNGALAGSLWYLHFRLTQNASDEKARQQAQALGLREDRDGAHRDMWLAVQKYLSDNPR